jgi:GNAT superfamily N-acetyltransferase
MLRIETEAGRYPRDLVHARLRETNSRRSPVLRSLRGTAADGRVPIEIHAFDGEELAGGLVAYAWAYWLHIDLLWVHEAHRGNGLGSRLMREAEEQARRRGCLHSRLETFDFQAADFYRKLGYEVIASVPDYPPGCTEHLMVKRL